jgi:hypothetical protein
VKGKRNMKIIRRLILVGVVCNLAGCTVPAGPAFSTVERNKNLVSVYVYRDSPPLFDTPPPYSDHPTITANGKQLGMLLRGSYIHFYANPGEIRLAASKEGRASWGYQPFEQKLYGEAGEVKYITLDFQLLKQNYLVVTIVNTWQVQFKEVSEALALSKIGETKRVVSGMLLDDSRPRSTATGIVEQKRNQLPLREDESTERTLERLKNLFEKKLINQEQYNEQVKRVLEK